MLSQWFVFRWSENFTSLGGIRVPLTVPSHHYFGVRNQQNSTRVLFHYPMLIHARATACLKHSDFFKVNVPSPASAQLRVRRSPEGRTRRPVRTHRQTGRPAPKSDYERSNCNNFKIRYWSWNYRGCWHQTCAPIDPREEM